MPALQAGYAPNLGVFLKSLKNSPLESSIENLIS
jgi:translation initiation factor eIF-2B subunit beta